DYSTSREVDQRCSRFDHRCAATYSPCMVEDATPSQEITLSLVSMAHGGDAVARFNGQVVFVRGGIPGERVRARVTERQKHFLRAKVIDVLEASPDRVTPPCPHAALCGGCQWQHISYQRQTAIKADIVREALTRIGGVAEPRVRPMIPAAFPFAYRNNIQVRRTPQGSLGFQERESHRVVPIEHCLLAHPLIDDRWQALEDASVPFERASLRVGIRTGESLIALEADQRPDPRALSQGSWVWLHNDGWERLRGKPWYHEELAGQRYRVSAGSFFQVHTSQAEQLVRLVLEMLTPQPGDSVLDVYCGVGVFALQLADHVRRVLAIESAPPAIADARVNGAGHENVSWHLAAAEQAIAELDGPWDKAVLDPPRAGCAPQVLQSLARMRVERIAYVSCEPSTLARDVKRLQNLGYHLVHVQPVDMFPQTFHVETVALIQRDHR
ncbi:MAG: class I SAM-dependent RNA methyltransferase, partial [Anaerolineae bacterium]|nr:class I SAM-dependent RNA methyltransferase [Anaerolineae bacterium]